MLLLESTFICCEQALNIDLLVDLQRVELWVGIVVTCHVTAKSRRAKFEGYRALERTMQQTDEKRGQIQNMKQQTGEIFPALPSPGVAALMSG
jgi:endo-1,4-beta-D-glucanase Y